MAYRAPKVPAGSLLKDLRCDVCIVGMGISGAMIAEALTADGHDVVAIDRRGPLKGSTPATTALVQYEIDQPLTKLVHIIGREKAERAWRRSRLAVANLKANIEALELACGLAERPSVYLAGDVLDPEALAREGEARARAGLRAEYLTAPRLREAYGISRKGALVSRDNLALDPRKLTAGLLLQAVARGARLHAPVEADAFEDSGENVTIRTKTGPLIRARHIVLATGYELAPGVTAKGHSVISTWAIATRPQKGALWPQEAFIWEASDPYLYMRATTDGRVICGGEDEDFVDEEKRDALMDQKAARISAKLGKLMPSLDTRPEFSWTGAFGNTASGLPLIGALPGRPRVHAVMGYGGNGITWSRIAAEVISAELAGRPDSDADLFAHPR